MSSIGGIISTIRFVDESDVAALVKGEDGLTDMYLKSDSIEGCFHSIEHTAELSSSYQKTSSGDLWQQTLSFQTGPVSPEKEQELASLKREDLLFLVRMKNGGEVILGTRFHRVSVSLTPTVSADHGMNGYTVEMTFSSPYPMCLLGEIFYNTVLETELT